ncbi:MAG: M48 family metalloprotease [Gammaproteobacteria bacterium]
MKPILAFALAATLLFAASCSTNPVTGQSQLALVSESQEIEIGRQTAAAAEAQMGLVDDPALQEYVQRIGMVMARASERPELPWHFGVIDDPTPNAFAAPGGFIYVTRGMLSLMNNEAELATVIGHEIGHVTARHSVAMISRQQLAQIGLGLGSVLSPEIAQLGELASAGLSMLFMSYGRDAERQADDLGFGYALAQGYDVSQMTDVFASLQRIGEASGRSPVPAWMSTHPYPEERIVRIQNRLAGATLPLGARAGEDEYMARVDGLPYGENPRNGYFENTRFVHPDMRFQVNFPQGWMTQNMAQAVMAGSPDQDAIVQLSLAKGTPQEAAAAFLGQQGITAGPVNTRSVNGLNAATAEFQAQTEQGALAGAVSFITLDEHTFGIVAYTGADRLPKYAAAFQGVFDSFGRLTDPQALAVQAPRLSVMRTPRAMSLQQFNASYPSTIPLDELALVNQLVDGSALIPAGAHVKRVVN